MALATLICAGLLLLTQLYLAIPIVPEVTHDLGGHDSAAALTTGFAIPYALGLVLFGALSDRYGRKRVLVPGLTVAAFTTAAVALAPSVPALAALRALQGAAAATFPAAANAYLAETTTDARRSAALGRLQAAYLAAAVAGQLYATVVTTVAGWRGTFLLSAIGLFAVAVTASRVLISDPQPQRRNPIAAQMPRLTQLTHLHNLGPLYLAGLTLLLPLVAMFAALGPRLSGTFGLDDRVQAAVRLAALPGLAAALGVGRLAARMSLALLATLGLLLAAAGLLILGAAAQLWLLVGAVVVFAAGIGVAVPSVVALVLERAGDSAGAAAAAYAATVFLGAGLAPTIASSDLAFGTLMAVLAGGLTLAAALVSTTLPAFHKHVDSSA